MDGAGFLGQVGQEQLLPISGSFRGFPRGNLALIGALDLSPRGILTCSGK